MNNRFPSNSYNQAGSIWEQEEPLDFTCKKACTYHDSRTVGVVAQPSDTLSTSQALSLSEGDNMLWRPWEQSDSQANDGRTVRELAGKRSYMDESGPLDLSNKRVCLDDKHDSRTVKNLVGELGNTTATIAATAIPTDKPGISSQEATEDKQLDLLCPSTSFKKTKQGSSSKKTKQGRWCCLVPGCNHIAPFPSKLKIHNRIHTGEKPYKCNFCGFSCNQNGNLKNHINLHKNAPKEQKINKFGKYACSICKQTCTSAYNLRTHMRMHTGEKPHPCKRCNLSFRSVSHVNRHVRRKHPEDIKTIVNT